MPFSPRPFLLSGLLLTAVCLPLWSADATPADTPTAGGVEQPVASPLDQPSSEKLLGQLPAAPAIAARDGAVYWDNGAGAAYRIQGVDSDGGAVLETEIGALPVPRHFLADDRTDILDQLPKLVATAQTAGLTVGENGLSVAEGIMTGVHLRSAEVLVLSEGVLRKVAADPGDRSAEVAAIERAGEELKNSIAPAAMDIHAHRTVEDVFARLPLTDTARKFEYDEMLPSFARRVVRNGWSRMLIQDAPLAERVEAAVTTAETMRPVTVFTGQGLRLAEVKNAFGQGGWILETPTRTSFARPHPAPMYAWGAERWNLLLVVDLPAGADPMQDGGKATAARLFQGSQVIAQWSRDTGFQADDAVWRRAVPATGRHVEETTVSNFIPPHLVIIDLDGDVRMLVTAHGALVPPRNSSTPEAQRFLADAAKSLPDAPHLDLVGEYLFYYVYDSPDPRFPLLIGNRQVKGDIHQTAYQTLATTANGICRGDCDDLSELYQAIIEEQGGLAHIITLPQHAAAAFARKIDDAWHVYILQTGQPREFVADELPEALRLAYLSFDDSDNFDPNGLGLLLRFSGENTRGSWRLSWRIFSDPEYAKTMIDVQKDWHYSTYQRGIHKMEALIAAGDDDTANYRELAGLAAFTGQYDAAAQNMREAISRTDEAESRLYAGVELVQHLFQAKRPADARAEALKLLNEDFPKLKKSLGSRAFQFGFQLASACSGGRADDIAEPGDGGDGDDQANMAAYDLAERAIAETMMTDLSEQIQQIAGWLESPQFDARRWEAASPLRRLQRLYVGASIAVIQGAGPDGIAKSPNLRIMVQSAQNWFDHVAFYDIDEAVDTLGRYVTAAAFYQALLGKERFQHMVDAAPLATTRDHDHKVRIGGIAQIQQDLPWIAASPTYWYGRMLEALARKDQPVDRELITTLSARLDQACTNLDKLGIEDPWIDHIQHQSKVIRAIITENEPVLRERLRYVTAVNDKRLRDSTSTWLGDLAPHCSPEWYAKILQAWVDECDYKPKYFWIAWRAALVDAPAHALMAAELAAKRFADDPAFQEELQFMRQLFEPTPAAGK